MKNKDNIIDFTAYVKEKPQKVNKKKLFMVLGAVAAIAAAGAVLFLSGRKNTGAKKTYPIIAGGDLIATPTLIAEPSGPAAAPDESIQAFREGLELSVGQEITFGRYKFDRDGTAEPVCWQVADTFEGSALIVTKNIVDVMCFSKAGHVTWEESDIRASLNGNFYNQVFTEKEKEHIMCIEVDNEDNEACGIDGGHDTADNVFILSPEEMERYRIEADSLLTPYAYFRLNEADRAESVKYWLRLPGGCDEQDRGMSLVTVAAENGSILYRGVSATAGNVGIRPAVWIKYSN